MTSSFVSSGCFPGQGALAFGFLSPVSPLRSSSSPSGPRRSEEYPVALGYLLCSTPQIDLALASSLSRVLRPLFSFSAARRFPSFRLFHAWWLICHGLLLTNLVFTHSSISDFHRTASLSRPLSVIRTLVKLKHKGGNRLISLLQWLTSALQLCVGQLPQTSLWA